MIAIDVSVLVAIASDKVERRSFKNLFRSQASIYVSDVSLFEARTVVFSRFGGDGVSVLDSFLLKRGVTVLETSPHMADIAFGAYRRFGKGTGHSASLSYGDCFSYALVKHLGVTLVFKGNGWSKTDISSFGSG